LKGTSEKQEVAKERTVRAVT